MRSRRALHFARSLAALAGGVMQQHYLSFLSAAVIAVVFLVAMTSSTFENPAQPSLAVHEDDADLPGQTGNARAVPLAQAEPSSAAARPTVRLTYYIVEDEGHRDAILDLLVRDTFTRFQTSGLLPSDSVFFVDASRGNAHEQIAWLQHDGALVEAGTEGVSLRIIDLRGESH